MTTTTLRSELINKKIKNKINIEYTDKKCEHNKLFGLLLEILQSEKEDESHESN